MRNSDLNRVVYYSKEDMAGPLQLKKGEHILKAELKTDYSDVNDVMELYNLKKYIDNELFLRNWTKVNIDSFKLKATEISSLVGKYMAKIDDSTVASTYNNLIREYISCFWEIVNNQSVFKRISKLNFKKILDSEPHVIHVILTNKKIVDYYDSEIRDFLMSYSQSAEILLSVYEVQHDFSNKEKFIPRSLTIEDKETIMSSYLDSDDFNLNYVELIQNSRKRNDFVVSDKTRLKAKRLHQSETEKFFAEKGGGLKYGVSVSFPSNASKIKDGEIDDEMNINYSYSLDFIRENNDPYSLYKNFKVLFEYIDGENRIALVSKRSQLGLFEKIMGVRAQNEYRGGSHFNLLEMTSHLQIAGYNRIVLDLKTSLEEIFHHVWTSSLREKYDFVENARFLVPTSSSSYFEKVRILAPEFESVLKQYKLFVEDGNIDFDLLQMSSAPSSIKDIPSLNSNKYFYLNEGNETILGCLNLFFSDQTLLSYVEPFKESKYANLFELLANEQVLFSNYADHQRPQIEHLIDNGFLSVDADDFIQFVNPHRIAILKDLRDNEVASFHHYSPDYRLEAQKMESEDIIIFESSLFTKPEQAYFNYLLNKSEFTNGIDLRNSYLHGTQANPEETRKHEYAYFTYLKLLFLILLKIEDDLIIASVIKSRK